MKSSTIKLIEFHNGESIEKGPDLPAVSHKPRFIGLPSTITLAE